MGRTQDFSVQDDPKKKDQFIFKYQLQILIEK
jgi:hypothetical protein